MFTDQALLHYLASEIVINAPDMKIHCFTEHKRNGIMFRAHPLYKSTSPWYDWAMFQWSIDENVVIVPGQIMCFCNFQHVDFDACRHIAAGDCDQYTDIPAIAGNEFLSATPGIYAVIQSLASPLEAIPNSKLIRKGV